MKLKIIIYFYFISLNLAAQPGEDYGYTERRFAELTEKLKLDPNNYDLIWKRIALSRFPHTYFDIYKKSGNLNGYRYFKNSTELFVDLNKLIDNNVVSNNHNIAKLKMLRGKLYYLSGETDKALDDYLFALNYNASFHNSELNDDIYIAIAAYYYNLEEKLTEQNARQTLQYVNMANPNGCHSNQTSDCYEKEKKELLKFLKEEQSLITFYKNLILTEYKNFMETQIGGFITTDYVFNKNRYYFGTLKRINDLAEYYNEIGNYKKSKSLTKQLIKFLPPNNNGQPYKTFPKEKLYGISSEDYSQRFFTLHHKNQYKELTWDYKDMSDFIKRIDNY